MGSISALEQVGQFYCHSRNKCPDVVLQSITAVLEIAAKKSNTPVIGAEANIPRVELQCLKVLAKFL